MQYVFTWQASGFSHATVPLALEVADVVAGESAPLPPSPPLTVLPVAAVLGPPPPTELDAPPDEELAPSPPRSSHA